MNVNAHFRSSSAAIAAIGSVLIGISHNSQPIATGITPVASGIDPVVMIAATSGGPGTAEGMRVGLDGIVLERTDRIRRRTAGRARQAVIAVGIHRAITILAAQKHAPEVGNVERSGIGGTPHRADGGEELDIIGIRAG